MIDNEIKFYVTGVLCCCELKRLLYLYSRKEVSANVYTG